MEESWILISLDWLELDGRLLITFFEVELKGRFILNLTWLGGRLNGLVGGLGFVDVKGRGLLTLFLFTFIV